MFPASRHRSDLRDYLDIEEMSQVKHEFLDGEIVAMAGGTPEHPALAAAVVIAIGAQLRGRPCRAYSADLRLRIPATGLATYADATVVCGELARDPQSPTHVTNPAVVVEVLSPSTEEYDRGDKRLHYQRLDSLREYVLIDSTPVLGVYGASERIALESIGCQLDVDDLYASAAVEVD